MTGPRARLFQLSSSTTVTPKTCREGAVLLPLRGPFHELPSSSRMYEPLRSRPVDQYRIVTANCPDFGRNATPAPTTRFGQGIAEIATEREKPPDEASLIRTEWLVWDRLLGVTGRFVKNRTLAVPWPEQTRTSTTPDTNSFRAMLEQLYESLNSPRPTWRPAQRHPQ
jgi:hypothetical protein